MPPRRGSAHNTLAPQDAFVISSQQHHQQQQLGQGLGQGQGQGQGQQQTRSASPSGAFTQFLTRPSKWFSRSASASKAIPGPSADQPRPSVSSGRKHKISRPTDPRPIMDSYAQAPGARSVMDLSRTNASIDGPRFHAPSVPSSPITHPGGINNAGGLGDLRNISKRGWSRSADDLSKISPHQHQHSPNFSPTANRKNAFQERVAEYRNRTDSNTSVSPSSPTSPSPSHNNLNNNSLNGRHPFPSAGTSPPSATSIIPPRSATLPTLSISVAGPSGDSDGSPSPSSSHPSLSKGHPLSSSPPSQGQSHTRSHSFTPKLPSKLATRNPSTPTQLRAGDREADASLYDRPQGTPTRAAFGFGFGNLNAGSGRQQQKTPPDSFNFPSMGQGQPTTLLPPPTIIEPRQQRVQPIQQPVKEPDTPTTTTESKRASQIVYNSGFINRLTDVPASILPSSASHPNAHTHSTHLHHAHAHAQNRHSQNVSAALSKGWKPFKLEMKGSKLYFYKPPSDRANAIKELFPTSLVPPSEEEPDESGGNGNGGGGGGEMLGAGLGAGMGMGSGMGGNEREGRLATGGVTAAGGGGRKKRAFWGRRTHPDLVKSLPIPSSSNSDSDSELLLDCQVEKGTFEALTHEAVFATTFFGFGYGAVGATPPPIATAATDADAGACEVEKKEDETSKNQDDEDAQKDQTNDNPGQTQTQPESLAANARKARWQHFASTVLFSLPLIVSPSTFEPELLRCCSYLVSGADDAQREWERERVEWIVKEYVRLHGGWKDEEGWELFRGEVVPGLVVPSDSGATGEGEGGGNGALNGSASIRAVFHPSPSLSSTTSATASPNLQQAQALAQATSSPNINMFSPRPEDGTKKTVSLLDALSAPLPPTIGGGGLPSRPGMPVGMGPQHSSHTHTPSPPHVQGHAQVGPNGGSSSTAAASRIPWAALNEEGLTREMLFYLDPHLIARSLQLFHRSVLERCPENVTAGFILPSGESLISSSSRRPTSEDRMASPPASTYLFGSDDKPHWLTKLLLVQILSSETQSSSLGAASGYQYPASPSTILASPSQNGVNGHVQHQGQPGPGQQGHGHGQAHHHHPQAQTSRTHSRSEVISAWARVGELCRMSGDECSWRAIAAALTSRPIARLDKVWKRVDPGAVRVIEGWVHGRSGGNSSASGSGLNASNTNENAGVNVVEDANAGGVSVGQPQITPWGGDVKTRVGEELGRARGENGTDSMIQLGPLDSAKSHFEAFRTAFALCPRRTYVQEGEIPEEVRRMVGFWREMAGEGGARGGLAVKFQRVDQFMSLSLAAEPRRKGLFEPHFWTRPTGSNMHMPYTSLIPLLFPDPLPALTLVDRSKLVRGRIDSDASEMQYLRGIDAQLRQEAGRQLHSLSQTQEFTKRLILGSGGTLIPVYNGDLLLMTQSGGFESAPNSRPGSSAKAPSRPESAVEQQGGAAGPEKSVSRNPSIRVKPSSSSGLDRKTSMARRSSLPTVSHLSRSNFVTTSEPSSDPPLRVVVHAGTLNSLVNLLVHGLENVSVSVADDNGEMTLREGMTRDLVLDRVEFSRVWWNVYRSFVTPFVFFELLRKIYLVSQPSGSSPSPTEQYNAARKQTEVLTTMVDWLKSGGGAQDVLDDSQLFTAVHAFIDTAESAVVPSSDFPPVLQAYESLSEMRSQFKLTFSSQTRRPTITRGMHGQHQHNRSQVGTRTNARARNTSTREPPDLDRMDAEEFVDNLDGMAAAAFNNITQEDLYITADLLEVQSSDRTGWFSPRDAGNIEELVEIQNIYSHLQEVEPSSLISEISQDVPLYRLLPPGVRTCIRAFGLIRKWLISKLVAPRIGLRARQHRMELLIQAIELSRLRNTETPSTTQLIEQPCVRSFVEAVATSALLSIESRLHHRAWQSVAMSRNCTCDSLSALLHRPYVQSTATQDSLTIDVGWLLERMIEIIATPDILDASSQEGQQLVNFDKRRHLCNLISKAAVLPSARKPTTDEGNRRAFERLNNIEKEVFNTQFDHRGIKDEAMREAANPGMNGALPSKKTVRPFSKVVAIQVEKHRRDKNLRSRLQREKLQEQTKNEKRDDLLNKAMRPRKQPANPPKVHRNKKSMSVFLNFMRPISSAFGAEIPYIMPKRTVSELDFPTNGKPTLVLSVLDAQVSQFLNNERSYMFQLDTEDGGHYLLQARSKREMNKWLETISKVTKTVAQRRLTYLGNSPTPQIADHIHQQTAPSRDPQAVFGVELEFLLRREAGGADIPPGTVPVIIEQCMKEVELRGLAEVGIYRIAGATTEINGLKDAYNRGEYPIQSTTDIHAICDLVKSWFRVLPEPVFPPSSYREVMDAMRIENLEDRLTNIRNVVQALPQANFDILRRVSEHLDRVTDFEEHNHMTADALAIVFSPNLLRAPQNDFVMILNNMGLSHKLVKALITHFHVIFDEADPEAEQHDSEDELESPIQEEDEEEEEVEEEEEEADSSTNYHATHDPMHDPNDSSIIRPSPSPPPALKPIDVGFSLYP